MDAAGIKHVLAAFTHGAVITKNGAIMYAVDLVSSPVVIREQTTWDPVDHEAEARYSVTTRH